MTAYIPTPRVPRERLSSMPEGAQLTVRQARGAVALGLVTGGRALVLIGEMVIQSGPALGVTLAQLDAAGAAAEAHEAARQDLRDTQAMLDERYRLYNRAGATGNVAAQAEIQTEITDLLDYMKELRNASNPA